MRHGGLLGKDGKLSSKRRVRHLDGTMLSAVLGTSWWELNDLEKEMGRIWLIPEAQADRFEKKVSTLLHKMYNNVCHGLI